MTDRVKLTGGMFGMMGRALLLGHPPWCACAECQEIDGLGEALAERLAQAANHGLRQAPPVPPPPRKLPAKGGRRTKAVQVQVSAPKAKALPAGGGRTRAGRPSPAPGGDAPEVEVEVIPPGAPVRRRRG